MQEEGQETDQKINNRKWKRKSPKAQINQMNQTKMKKKLPISKLWIIRSLKVDNITIKNGFIYQKSRTIQSMKI